MCLLSSASISFVSFTIVDFDSGLSDVGALVTSRAGFTPGSVDAVVGGTSSGAAIVPLS